MKLQAKLLFFVLSLSVASTALIVWITSRSIDEILTTDVTRAAVGEALELAGKSASEFQNKNEIAMLEILQESQNTTHASHALVLDQSGRVRAHTNVIEKSKVYDDAVTRELLKAETPQVRVQKRGLDSIAQISAPIWKKSALDATEQLLLGNAESMAERKRLGTVLLIVPLRDSLITKNRIVRQMAATMLLIGFVALIVTAFLINGILRPVRFLAEGTAKISSGGYGAQIPVSSKDELGALTADFNRMSRVLAETAVSKDFMTGILEKMQDALIIIDDQGRVKMLNRAAVVLLGYEEKELVGKPLGGIFEDKKNPQSPEAEFVTKTGDRVPVLYSLSEFSAKGELILVARDVGERKRMETVLRRSEKMSAVGQLAAGVAHEINNPLGVILGFAQAVVRRLQKDDPLELPLKSIESEAIRCKNLVQDLLTFSRVSKTEREPVDLNRAVESCLSLVITKAKMAKITVAKELAENLPRTLGNASQIQQVLINLANNALDAMPNGGTLLVKTEPVTEGPLSWIRLSVSDSGTGIPSEILTRIFEPFFTTKGVGKGTGLGLSLVHEIIKKHSGMIDVQSRPGKTEFQIKLPVRTGVKSLA